jgi:hypothetical protein
VPAGAPRDLAQDEQYLRQFRVLVLALVAHHGGARLFFEEEEVAEWRERMAVFMRARVRGEEAGEGEVVEVGEEEEEDEEEEEEGEGGGGLTVQSLAKILGAMESASAAAAAAAAGAGAGGAGSYEQQMRQKLLEAMAAEAE